MYTVYKKNRASEKQFTKFSLQYNKRLIIIK